MTAWPRLLTGNNSVTPCSTAMMIACKMVMAKTNLVWSKKCEPDRISKRPAQIMIISSQSADGVPTFVHAVELLLELVVADGADHDFLADDERRGAVDLQRVGHVHHFLEAGGHIRALDVLVEPV